MLQTNAQITGLNGNPNIWTPPSYTAKTGRPANPNPSDSKLEVPDSSNNGVIRLNVKPTSPIKERIARTNTGIFQAQKDYLAALPKATDDLDRELGLDVIRRMLQDPHINSSIYLIAMACLSRGMRIKPRITDTKDPRYPAAVKMQRFIQYNIDQLENSFTETLTDMIVGALSAGNSVAEQTWKIKEYGEWDGKLVLSTIKNKPPEVYAFLIDRFGNVPGLASYTGTSEFRHPLSTSPIYLPGAVRNGPEIPYPLLGPGWEMVPITKFAVMTYRKRYNDPRGQSALRAAFGAWYLLMQIWPEYLKYLTQFASPSIVGILPENAPGEWNPNTNAVEDPLDVLYEELLNFANGTAIALRWGGSIDLKYSVGDGTPFLNAISLLNHQMVKAILHQLLATEEGKHQARAASSTHQDMFNIAVRGLKNMVTSTVQRQIFMPLIRMNFGDLAAENLCPWCSLGDIAPEDKSAMVTSYSASGYSTGPSQWPDMDAELELKVRTPEEAQADFDAANKANQAQANAVNKAKSNNKANNQNNAKKSPNDAKPAKRPRALALAALDRLFKM